MKTGRQSILARGESRMHRRTSDDAIPPNTHQLIGCQFTLEGVKPSPTQSNQKICLHTPVGLLSGGGISNFPALRLEPIVPPI
jgi:hypothetical protein